MSLSCSCDYDGYGPYYYPPDDYSVMPDNKRRKRCSSCGTLIEHGSTVAEFTRDRCPQSDIEESIYGDGPSVPLASVFLCETCADLYFSFYELGFECVSPYDNMRDLLKDYAALRGEGEK
jgi:predicted RNA-binding Zn-ribbon protein involved in translation (DUF1610 family)